MPYFSETEVNKIISFFAKPRTREEDEKLLRRFAAEYHEAFLKMIDGNTSNAKVESQFNNEIPDSQEGTIVTLIRELWLDENKNRD